ncbi:MAG: HIT domain-containing protein, partial [Nanoarchaeota archaeon]
MQLTPELKAQLAEQKKNCVFCKIVSKEMQGKVVFEDSATMALLDIYPAVKGHTLFILKEHYPILPYVPADEFRHFFWLVPSMAKAMKSAMVTLGLNVFIASGGVAGQQAPHVMMHFMPRDEGDGFFNFLLKKGTITKEEQKSILAYNLPLFMNDHFTKNPAPWHQGAGEQPAFLEKVYSSGTVLYEDEKLICLLPAQGAVAGQVD